MVGEEENATTGGPGRRCTQEVTFMSIIRGFIKENKRLFLMYSVFLFIIPLQDVGVPHIIGKIVKSLGKDVRDMVPQLISIIGITILLQIAYTLADYVEVKMYPAMVQHVRSLLLEHLLNQQRINYSELKLADITTTLIKLPNSVYGVIEVWKNLLIPQIIVHAVSICYVSYFDVWLGFLMFVLVCFVYYGAFKTLIKCERISTTRDYLFNAINEEVDDMLRNSITVLNYNQEASEMQRISSVHSMYAETSEKCLNCALSARYTFTPLIFGFLIYFVYRCHQKVRSRKLKLPSFISLFIITLQVTSTLWKMIAYVKDIVVRWGIIKHAMSIFLSCDRAAGAASHADKPYSVSIPGIYLKDITFAFDSNVKDERSVLNKLTLWLAPHQTTLIVGKIGSGKSTILKLIMRYLQPSSGDIYLDGVSYKTLSPDDIRSRIGYIPQNPILFNRTIFDNISYGMKNVSRERIARVLTELGVEDIIQNMSKGLDTEVGKLGSHLSGGQRQIIWIVRTILQGYDVLVIDEPTSAIDAHTKARVQKLLSVAMKGKTVVIVTHDQFLKEHAHRIIEMEDGKVIRDSVR